MTETLDRRLLIGDVNHARDKGRAEAADAEKIIQERMDRYEIFPDAQKRFEATLEAHNYEPVRELENGLQYPTLNEWLRVQLLEQGWARLYPTFVRDKDSGEVFFCKARIRTKEWWGLIKTEANVLKNLPTGSPAPRLIKYIPEDDQTGQLELLVTEAVKFSEGSVLPADEWTPEHARSAISELKELEKTPIKDLPELPAEPAITIKDMVEHSADVIEPSFSEKVQEILAEYEPYAEPVLIHGDTWIRNIILSYDQDSPKATFVDWERGGAGYRGQDVARVLWNLWGREELQQACIDTYLNEGDSGTRAARKIQLKFGVALEALRWLADRNDKLKDAKKQYKHAQIRSELGPIHEKVRAMLDVIEAIDVSG